MIAIVGLVPVMQAAIAFIPILLFNTVVQAIDSEEWAKMGYYRKGFEPKGWDTSTLTLIPESVIWEQKKKVFESREVR